MSFFYLFIPTWVFTILVYTFLAARYGAKDAYPKEEEQEKIRNQNIAIYQEQKGKMEKKHIKDTSIFSRILKVISVTALVITLILAGIVLFDSADENIYIANRAQFYQYAFICTILYFITAYWAFQRAKQKQKI